LLATRKQSVIPLLPAMQGKGEASLAGDVLNARWPAGGKALLILANMSDDTRAKPEGLIWGNSIWGGTPPDDLPPWSVYAAIGN
jgi:maltooligosyltrehalose trehalohydrolase